MLSATFKTLLERPADSHKYDFGHVLVLGGSTGMSGAVVLSAHAALRTGAGLVTVGTSTDAQPGLRQLWPEIMTAAIDNAAVLATFCAERKVTVVVIGPGLRPSAQAAAQLQWLLTDSEVSLVVDGGALSLLSTESSAIRAKHGKAVVLTPHVGEFRRLVTTDLGDERAGQQAAARSFAANQSITLVLKGPNTYVVDATGQEYTNTTGNPGLATAGSGDVLSGIIAGIMAQDIATWPASAAAVYMHGLCGDLAAQASTEPAVIASDLIAAIPRAYKQIQSSGIDA